MTKKEFLKLKPGDIIKSKNDTVIVSQNFGERLIGVRTIEVRNPKEWELFKPDEPKDNKLEMAAHKLYEQLNCILTGDVVGMGDNKLIVYTKEKIEQKMFTFEGFDVEYKHTGDITPVGEINGIKAFIQK